MLLGLDTCPSTTKVPLSGPHTRIQIKAISWHLMNAILHLSMPCFSHSPLTGGSLTPVIIDVTRPDTISTAVQQVQEGLHAQQPQPATAAPPGLTALVNNAGKVTLAPLEFMPIEVFEDQLNVNLVGVLRVTQAFLPLMRQGVPPGGWSAGHTGQACVLDC